MKLNLGIVGSQCFVLIWIIIEISDVQAEVQINHEHVTSTTCSLPGNPASESSNCEKRESRYIIYNVNPGEGFNLRRDIYVRVAPLVHRLNAVDKQHKWVLVLPPWSNIPHWSTRKVFPWSTFFQMEKVNEYIPAVEFVDFMDDYDLHEGIGAVFQLQHLPLSQNEDWKDKLEFGVECQDPFPYQLDENEERYVTTLWNHRITAKKAECTALRGTASTLLNFLLGSNYRSLLFEHAEVILWDSYGDKTWWKARTSQQFSAKLQEVADTFIKNQIPHFNLTRNKTTSKVQLSGNSFIGVHLRRRDFLHRNSDSGNPTIRAVAAQIYTAMQMLDTYRVFVASDTFQSEIQDLKLELDNLAADEAGDGGAPSLFQFRSLDLSEGEIAIVDQIICSRSAYFIGTKDSTFTTRIFEEREILKCFDPMFTFNSFCADVSKEKCEQPTQWRISL